MQDAPELSLRCIALYAVLSDAPLDGPAPLPAGDVYAHNVLADAEGNPVLCDYGEPEHQSHVPDRNA